MSKEFNLSEKIWKMPSEEDSHINIDDVKEFIRLLKENFELRALKRFKMSAGMSVNKIFVEEIDKLAGDKLIDAKVELNEQGGKNGTINEAN